MTDLAKSAPISESIFTWLNRPVPMNINGRDREKVENRDVDRLEETHSGIPKNDSEFRINDKRAQIPQWLLLFLILQGGGIIWWAATMQSDLKYLQVENAKLWTRLESVDRAIIEKSKEIDAQVRDSVSDEIASQLLRHGIIRIQPSNP